MSHSTNHGPTGASSAVSERADKARQEADTRELATAPRNRSRQRSARLAIACAVAAVAVAAMVLARRLTEPTPTSGPVPPTAKQKAAPSPALPPPAPSFHVRHCLAPRLTHVVYTRGADGTACLYLNGSAASAGPIRGDLSNWDEGMRFGLANEVSDDRTWLGELHLVAVYGRALSAEEIARHFDAGPGGDTPER